MQNREAQAVAVTIKDVSARCGLSISTVSKAFNNYSDISSETRELVHRTAREIGYYPNAIARTLKTNRSSNLGVLFADDGDNGLTHSFFASVLNAFKSESEKHGYDITFINHNVGWNGMTYLEHCRYRNVDGVCIVCADFERDEVRELVSGELPVVTIDHVYNNRTCIQSDNRQGMADLTRHILSMGHRRIAYICGQTSAVTTQRKTTFLRTMSEAGLSVPDESLVEACYHDPAATREATLRLLGADPRPTCILMPDDYAFLGGREAILSAGLRIPEDISVAGYDGVQLIQLCQPRLTTIWQDTDRIGREAARQLVHLIEQPRTTCPEILPIACRLLEGETISRL